METFRFRKFLIRLKIMLFFVGAGLSYGQNAVIDSLITVTESDQHDTLKCLAYSDLCWEYRLIDQKKAIEAGQEGINLSRQIDYKFGEGRNLNDLSIIYMDKGSLDTAILLLNQAKDIRVELEDQMGVAAIHNKLGIIYEHQVKLEDALNEHLSALAIYEEFDIKPNIGFCLNNIGNVHFKMLNYPKALEIHEKALTLRKSIDDWYGIAGSHSNIANTYQFMGDTAKSIYHYDEAIKVYRENDFKNDLAVTLNNLGSLYVGMGEYDKALTFVNEAYDLRVALGDARGISSSSIILGEIYTEKGNYSRASTLLYEGLRISKESGLFNKEKAAYEKLAKLYAAKNNADSVYHYYGLFSLKEKELYQENLQNQVNELETIYETTKKEQENEKLAKENAEETARRKSAELATSVRNVWIISITSFLVVSILVGLIFFQRFRRKKEEEKSKAVLVERDKGIKAVIQTQEKERARISKDLHDGIGQQLSGIKLAWSGLSSKLGASNPEELSNLIELTKVLDESAIEVRNLSHQMMPKLLSEFGLSAALKEMMDKSFQLSEVAFEYDDLNINDRRFTDEVELGVYRVAQELVNNVIKHAEASKVELQIHSASNQIHVLVIDNGKGFDPRTRDGQGLLNMETRLNAINGSVHYEFDGGTSAHVKVSI